MKRLLLARHAEAEAAVSGSRDFERRLTRSGRAEVAAAADCIVHTGINIELILASPAARTRETTQILSDRLPSAQVRYEPLLYLGSPHTLLQVLQRCESQLTNVLLIGHNPGISELASHLSPEALSCSLRTAGVCCLRLPLTAWSELEPASTIEFSLLR